MLSRHRPGGTVTPRSRLHTADRATSFSSLCLTETSPRWPPSIGRKPVVATEQVVQAKTDGPCRKVPQVSSKKRSRASAKYSANRIRILKRPRKPHASSGITSKYSVEHLVPATGVVPPCANQDRASGVIPGRWRSVVTTRLTTVNSGEHCTRAGERILVPAMRPKKRLHSGSSAFVVRSIPL